MYNYKNKKNNIIIYKYLIAFKYIIYFFNIYYIG